MSMALLAACGRGMRDTPGTDNGPREAVAHYGALLNGAPPNADSVSSMYAPDGELLANGRNAIRGPAAIRAFLAGFGNVKVDSAGMPITSVTMAGDHALVWGTYHQRAILPPHDTVRPRGRYVMELVQDSTRKWKIRRAMTQP
jgi:ketosteroid isomerase-like protein